ncbi:MAG: ATP-binding protein [Bryobacteraceae bacterium]
MWIDREIQNLLPGLVRSRPVVVVTGARQTGKTSLLQKLLPDIRYISLDLPSDAELANRQPRVFMTRYPPPLIVDEVQYAPRLFRHIKYVVDADRPRNGQFILTGSQRFGLMKEVSDSLAGRIEVVDLEPLSAREIRNTIKNISLTDLILRGGYPELYRSRGLDSHRFYRSYIATYLERDVRTLLGVSSLRDFERFLRACALRTAQLLNKADLARDVGISPSTANQWLSVLQASAQVVLLEPYFSNQTRSLVKSPKLYLTDTGVLAALLNIQTADELRRSPLIGAIWETFVFGELRKREAVRQRSHSIHFWHDRLHEVDFVIDRGGRYEFYDAKWTEEPDSGDASQMEYLRQTVGSQNVIKAGVICRTHTPFPLSRKVRAISIDDL